MPLQSINPATGQKIRSYADMSPDVCRDAVNDTYDAFLRWRDVEIPGRAERMKKTAALLREQKNGFALLMAQEMGKPLAQGRAEIEKCAWVCDHYAEHTAAYLAPEPVKTDAANSYVLFQPLGVVLAVMPWNFPFWQVFRFAAPALMAGNGAVLKHASNVCGCSLAIEKLFVDAGFPGSLFRSLIIGAKQVDAVIEHPHVAAVTLTGSTPAGRAVAAKAGAALKKSVLELGGSDPYLVLADADIEKAAEICVHARLINSGQSCVCAKRFIVVEEVLDAFTKRFVELMKARKMGDPLQDDVDIGPLARRDLRDELHEQVRRSVAQGAELLLGGAIPDGKGAFYPATVLGKVRKGQPAYDEELFGPVAAIIAAKDDADAVRIANDNPYGLGAAVFTRDEAKGEGIAAQLEAGNCFVNDFVKSDPRLPFGGIKESGYGRELSAFGIREFVNIKTVWVK